MKKIIKTAVSLMLTIGVIAASAAFAAPGRSLPFPRAAAAGQGINVNVRTEDEIRQYVQEHPYDTGRSAAYDKAPQTVYPYDAGEPDRQTLDDALNALNTVRYIAGLEEVSLKSELNYYAQAASLVNCVNGSLSHFPKQPSDMPDDLYQDCYTGAGSSNIGSGYKNPADSVIRGYVFDSDPSNISKIGHRRWCLNPRMLYTGFGQAGRYTAMYAFDRGRSSELYGVCWPAQNMPVEYFGRADTAWSVSMGYYADISDVAVTLTRTSDGKTWVFRETGSDGDFYVNNEYYGQIGCIIFRPAGIEGYSDGDVFTVRIDGLEEDVSYTVDFFSIDSGGSGAVPGDVNGDKIVDGKDLTRLMKYLSGEKVEVNADALDVNGDKTVDARDLVRLMSLLSE